MTAVSELNEVKQQINNVYGQGFAVSKGWYHQQQSDTLIKSLDEPSFFKETY